MPSDLMTSTMKSEPGRSVVSTSTSAGVPVSAARESGCTDAAGDGACGAAATAVRRRRRPQPLRPEGIDDGSTTLWRISSWRTSARSVRRKFRPLATTKPAPAVYCAKRALAHFFASSVKMSATTAGSIRPAGSLAEHRRAIGRRAYNGSLQPAELDCHRVAHGMGRSHEAYGSRHVGSRRSCHRGPCGARH